MCESLILAEKSRGGRQALSTPPRQQGAKYAKNVVNQSLPGSQPLFASYPLSVILFSGAGLSAESGIATFRDSGGVWERADPSVVCSADSMERHPSEVYRFFNDRWEEFRDARPNPAHYAVAKLQRCLRGKARLHVITQNIDTLLEQAGVNDVIHMHGCISESRCTRSGRVQLFDGRYSMQKRCGCCEPGALLRPNVVFFGEMPMHMELISDALRHCDVFCSVGTSGAVMPAGGFAATARKFGCTHLVELNDAEPVNSADFSVHLRGKAGRLMPALVSAIRRFAGGESDALEKLGEDCARMPGAAPSSEDCLVEGPED